MVNHLKPCRAFRSQPLVLRHDKGKSSFLCPLEQQIIAILGSLELEVKSLSKLTPARSTVEEAICLIHETHIAQDALIANTVLRENGICCRELFSRTMLSTLRRGNSTFPLPLAGGGRRAGDFAWQNLVICKKVRDVCREMRAVNGDPIMWVHSCPTVPIVQHLRRVCCGLWTGTMSVTHVAVRVGRKSTGCRAKRIPVSAD